MGTRHDEQERDIELNAVTEKYESKPPHESKNATSSDFKKNIKRAIVHYHNVLKMNQLYLFLVTIGVSMDTLFLFIPNIDKDEKCVIIEKDVKNVVLIVRSVTDIFFLERILYKVLVRFCQAKRSLVYYFDILFDILIDILCVAPLPQALIGSFFTGEGRSEQLIKKKNLNSIIVFQYFPRASTIYLIYLRIQKNFISPKAVIFWNLLFFFGLSHIFGSFWYFFALQQETSCASNMFDCKNTTGRNSTINFCSVNQTFDFGIYTEAIEADLLVTRDIPRKIIHSFWWGLRNLTSCGQNLQSSGYLWETCFGALITTAGLVLFLYFIGQVQVYLEVLVGPIIKEKWDAMKYRELEVDMWFNDIPDKDKIKKLLKKKIRYMPEIKDINLKILVPLLPVKERTSVKRWLCYPILEKVAILQNMNNEKLKDALKEIITSYLKPVIYSKNSYIICEGKSLDFMLLLTQGVIQNFKPSVGDNNSVNIMGNCRHILKENVYGEELLEWIFKSTVIGIGSDSDICISDTNVKAHTKVEAFAIMDNDIRLIFNRFKIRIIHNLAKSGKFDLKLVESIAASFIQSNVRRPHRHRRYDQNKKLCGIIDMIKIRNSVTRCLKFYK